MSASATKKIVNAWRDYDYFETLPAEEKARIPESPAGPVKLGVVATSETHAAETFQGHCATYIASTCDTYISGCCSTYISNTCDTYISSCCGSGT